jgi:calcineurin-like phosphoesterase family protein
MKYFTADPHYGNGNVIDYCNRIDPGTGKRFRDLVRMDRFLIKITKETLTNDDDELIIIGDLTFRGPIYKPWFEEFCRQVPHKKTLILGNHDRLDPFDYIKAGFWQVATHLEITMGGIDFVLVHDPATAIMDKSKIFLCGHIHTLFKVLKNVINVGIDVWDYKPVNEVEITELAKEMIKSNFKMVEMVV